MSILGAVLDGIAQGLGIESSDVEALTKLLHPEEFDSRKDESVALEAAIGYDPERYWNRKEMLETLRDLAGITDDDDGKEPSSEAIDKALEHYESLRDSFFEFAFNDATNPDRSTILSNKATSAKDLEVARDMQRIQESTIMARIDALLEQPGDSYTINHEDVVGKTDDEIFEFVKEQILNNRAERALDEDDDDFDDYSDDDDNERSLSEEAQEIDEAEYNDDDVEYPEEIDDLDEEDE